METDGTGLVSRSLIPAGFVDPAPPRSVMPDARGLGGFPNARTESLRRVVRPRSQKSFRGLTRFLETVSLAAGRHRGTCSNTSAKCPTCRFWAGVAPPDLRQASRRRGFIRLQQAYTTLGLSPCKQKRPRRTAFNFLIFLRRYGAGEGIRTLDPNLGKVVLYP